MAVREIHPEHLNTPRLVADSTGTPVWSWAQQEPFGVNVPDENPSGLGVFEFPLRFPGQYADKETGLYYNYFRDYDPSLGRYKESDPIGVFGGLNTYTYVRGDPLGRFDPSGLMSACQINWLNQTYGALGGFLVNFFNLQQFNPNSPGFGQAVTQAGAAAVAKYGATGGVQYVGSLVGQKAATAALSLAGQSIAVAGYCASATVTSIGTGFTTFATLAYQLSVQACVDPLTGRQRD